MPETEIKPKIKSNRGRKTLFRAEIIHESEIMASYGLTEAQIANVLNVSPFTLSRWKRKNPEFEQALKRGADISNHQVTKSLFHRALGYGYNEVSYEKVTLGNLAAKVDKKAEIETILNMDAYKTKVVVKQVLPDVTAQIFWLKNRQPDLWREKHEVDLNVRDLASELDKGNQRLLNYGRIAIPDSSKS